jgi:metallopeptidase MepB
MHDLVARTKYARHHGFAVTLELGEGIGMMFEQWFWLKNELTALSMHYIRTDPAYMEAWKVANPGMGPPPEKIPQSLLHPRLARHTNIKADRLMSIL